MGNNSTTVWDGNYYRIHKHGNGTEYNPKTHVSAYGEYLYGKRIGIWEFCRDSKIEYIREYNRSNGDLVKIINCQNNEQKQVFPPVNNQ